MPIDRRPPAPGPNTGAGPPFWSVALRVLREARGVTQEGWAVQLGVGRRTVQRWERGETPPDSLAEAAIAAYCAEKALYRRYEDGPLQGITVTREWLHNLIASARMRSRATPDQSGADAAAPADRPPRTAVPAGLTHLLGREADIAEIARRLQGTRLLTLTGPGGSGKTRLAYAVAAAVEPDFADGVAVVELAPIQETDVIAAIARSLAVEEVAARPLLDGIAGALYAREMLIVLDNFEHVIETAAVLTALLLRCPRLRMLVTSQTPLRVSGEQVYGVAPLPAPARLPAAPALIEEIDAARSCPSVQLFEQRAAAVRGDFALTPDNARAVCEICTRLDGLPLAIELAAARTTMLSPHLIAARLDQSLTLLSGGALDLPPRQRTIRAALTWSHDLLSADEQRLLHRLAVFVGGFTLEAVEAVAGDLGAAVLDRLSVLVDHNLVRVEHRDGSEPRFALAETVRQFVQEQLEQSGEAPIVGALHAAHMLELAERAEPFLMSSDRDGWLRRLAQEGGNLRAALHWSVDQGRRAGAGTGADTAAGIGAVAVGLRLVAALWVWLRHDSLEEGRRWAESVISLPRATSVPAYARALFVAGQLALSQGDRDTAARHLLLSVTLARAAADTRTTALALTYAALALAAGDPRRQACAEESLALARADGDHRGEAWALYVLSVVAAESGDRSVAREHAEQSVRLYRVLADRWLLALPLANLGRLAVTAGDPAEGAALLAEALALYRANADQLHIARVLFELGVVEAETGRSDDAIERLTESAATFRVLGLCNAAAAPLHALAEMLSQRGRSDLALRLTETARLAEAAVMTANVPDSPGATLGITPAAAAIDEVLRLLAGQSGPPDRSSGTAGTEDRPATGNVATSG